MGDKKKSVRSKKTTKREKYVPESLRLVKERDISLDFATKVYKKFDTMIKSIVLFGSSARKTATSDSDIDIIILIDDVTVGWDEELIAWYRAELGKIIQANPYKKSLHINTVKLSTWWQDLLKGDPVLINIIRYGDPLIDFGGFFSPLKILLQEGKIRSTPEAIYTLLQRAPTHLARKRAAMLAAVDGLYWAVVDSAHAALIAANIMPPSPEEIPQILKTTFVDTKILDSKYIDFYIDLHSTAKEIIHGKRTSVDGSQIDKYSKLSDEFVGEMARLINEMIEIK